MKKAIATVLISSMIAGVNFCAAPYKVSAKDLSDNRIVNNTFRDNTNTWGSISKSGGQLKVRQDSGTILTSIYRCGDVISSNQVYCEGFELYKNGKYCLEFDINSSVERMIEYQIQNGNQEQLSYVKSCISIDSDVTRVVKTFTMTEEHDVIPRLVFHFGNVSKELRKHDIRIANVRLYLVDDSKIQV